MDRLLGNLFLVRSSGGHYMLQAREELHVQGTLLSEGMRISCVPFMQVPQPPTSIMQARPQHPLVMPNPVSMASGPIAFSSGPNPSSSTLRPFMAPGTAAPQRPIQPAQVPLMPPPSAALLLQARACCQDCKLLATECKLGCERPFSF